MTYMVISWYSDGSDGSRGPTIDIAPNDAALVRVFETITSTGKLFRVFRCTDKGVTEIGTPRPE